MSHPITALVCNFPGSDCLTQPGTEGSTYTVSGSTITDDTGSSYDFCVSGNTMTQREPIEVNAYGVIQLKKR
jgi:hypothetical protein